MNVRMVKLALLSALCLSLIYVGFAVSTSVCEDKAMTRICGDPVDGGHPCWILTGDPVPGGGVPHSSNWTEV
jgi:hypothetical protein